MRNATHYATDSKGRLAGFIETQGEGATYKATFFNDEENDLLLSSSMSQVKEYAKRWYDAEVHKLSHVTYSYYYGNVEIVETIIE